MKQLFILLFSLISFLSYGQADSSKIKDIKRLLEVSGASNNAKLRIEAMIKNMKESTDQNTLPEDFLDELMKEINYQELTDIYIPIYNKHYTHQEILDLIKFYESPTGKKMLEKSPAVVAESINIGMEWGQKLGERVYEKMQKKQTNNN